MLYSRKFQTLALAIAACMASPMALAQSKNHGQEAKALARALSGEDAARSLSAGPRNPNAATPATPATPAVPGQTPAVPATPAIPAKKAWAALDADGNGTLTAAEASSVQKLSKEFMQADTNANGELNEEEYKAWLAVRGKDS